MPALMPYGLGWHPDIPDPRDYTPEHKEVRKTLGGLKRQTSLPKRIHWREYCPPIEDRGRHGASAACACAALLQYFQRRATGQIINPAKAFIHAAARRLLSQTGDGGEQLRAIWKTIVRFGVPREQDWPYEPESLAREPDAFAYASAVKFPGLAYVRLDARGKEGDAVLRTVKWFLAAGFPSVFGFPVCTTLSSDADISYPTVFDAVCGGQAAMAVGYDDQRRIRSWRGALLLANSMGEGWGDRGYGWLPYAYVVNGLALDFWTLVWPEWLASHEFGRPF